LFLRFPSEEEQKKGWLYQIGWKKFKPTKWATVCSEHFEPESYNNHNLKKDAIPTIFDEDMKLQQDWRRKKPKKRQASTSFIPNEDQSNGAKRKIKKHEDHNYCLPGQIQLKERNDSIVKQNAVLRKKLRLSKEAQTRLKKKCSSLKQVIQDLKEKDLVSEGVEELLKEASSKVPVHIFKRMAKSTKKKKTKSEIHYSKEMKAFAITLQFYSSKAYNYVRTTFGLSLPHESVVRKWYTSVNAEPGFTLHAFETLAKKVQEDKEKTKKSKSHLFLMRWPL
jgi:hypothetical protein